MFDQYRGLFDRDGFVVARGLLGSDEVEQLDQWIEEVANAPASETECLHHYEQTTGGVRLARTENFLPFHQGLRDLLTTGVVADILQALFGEPAVLYKEKINYKHPGGGGFAPHQDAPAFDDVQFHITCLLSVDPATEENGCLQLAAGEHTDGMLAMNDRGCLSDEVARRLDWKPCPLAPGDAVFFGSFTPHCSQANTSELSRRGLYVTYNAASEGEHREKYYADKLNRPEHTGQLSKIGHFQGSVVR